MSSFLFQTQLSWYSIDEKGNEYMVSSSTQRDITLNLLAGRKRTENIVGIVTSLHRICLDPYIVNPNRAYAFKCRAKSLCNEKVVIESSPMPIRLEGWLYILITYLIRLIQKVGFCLPNSHQIGKFR
jgi:hypothetical protein